MNSIQPLNTTPFQGPDCRGLIAHEALLELLRQRPLADILKTGHVLKEDRKRRVAVIKTDQSEQIFVKVHFHSNVFDRLKDLTGRSRAHRSHDKTIALIKHGLPTPESFGYVNFNMGSQHGSAHFTHFLEDSQTLFNVLKNNHQNQQQQLDWVELGFQKLAALHARGFVHGDLKLNNIMVQGGDLYYIDIDSAAQTTRCRARSKDLARFLVALSEADIAPDILKTAFSEYCQSLGLSEEHFAAPTTRIADRIQRKHLLKYQRPCRQIL